MRLSPLSAGILLFTAASIVVPLRAQQLPIPVPLTLDGDPQSTQAPGMPLNDAQCDGSGNLYLRYDNANDGSSRVLRVESDGSVQNIQLSRIPGHPDEAHVYTFSVAEDGSMHQAVQSWDTDGVDPDLRIYYVRFDQDGSVRSAAPFNKDFTPFVLLPFADGKFFAAGSLVKKSGDAIEESPRAGIFDSDAALIQQLRRRSPSPSTQQDPVLPDDSALQPETVRIGSDGNIYVLTSSDAVELKVFRPSGVLAYQLHLREPFETGIPSRLLVSGDRVLVVYEGEADNPKDSFLYVLYDAHTGEVVRAYKPDFSGTPVCMQDGQSITVLIPQKYSGGLAIGTAALQ